METGQVIKSTIDMKTYAVLMIFAAMYLNALAQTKSFGNINIEEYKDRARLSVLIDCLKARGACTWEEVNLRERGQEIVATKCESCSDAEKLIVRDLTSLLAQEYPDELATLFGIYDPTSVNAKPYLHSINTFSSQAGTPDIPMDVIERY